MGIVNVTPDSFSDGGEHADARSAIAHAERLVREGADLLDIGGESSRPGAATLTHAEEWRRIEPVLRAALTLGVPVSVDTCKPETMRAALALGVDIVNDIRALRAPGALECVAAHPACGVCLMHMRGDPATMQKLTTYADLMGEIRDYFRDALARAAAAGVPAERFS